jgi:ribosomal-protein-alanine N-acetyltransferase
MAARPKHRPDGKPSTGDRFIIRRARAADAARIHAIERACFGDPWSEASFREAIEATWSFVLVADEGGEVIGYLVGRDVAGTGEVLNLATDPRRRRQGIARVLLEEGLEELGSRGATEVFLEVRESNRPAQMLYRDAGFRPVGMRAKYYHNPSEDALVLRLGLGSLA